MLDNGRPGVEPVILLGVLIFQFLERVPDRQAAELVKYHLGWKLALNLDLNFKGIHHTSLSYFRERLRVTRKGSRLHISHLACYRLAFRDYFSWLWPDR